MWLGPMRWGQAHPRGSWQRANVRKIGFLLLFVGLFVTSACSTSTAQTHVTPTASATATQDPGPQTTNSSLLYPRHYQGQRVLTKTDLVNQIIAKMSIDEEVGQLIIAQFNDATFSSQDAAQIRQMHAGGLILYAVSVKTKDQTRKLINSAQDQADLPLLVMADEEGGFVDRLQSVYGGAQRPQRSVRRTPPRMPARKARRLEKTWPAWASTWIWPPMSMCSWWRDPIR